MIRVGLTGSIGMGKSAVLAMFADLGAATWDADAAVHRLYQKGGAAVGPVGAAFPGALADGAVDRAALSALVLGDLEKIKALEAIVHPLVAEDRTAFLEKAEAGGAKIAVLDIPLLFENNGESAFDAVVVVSAPEKVQRARVLSRPGMSDEKFQAILKLQTPDAEKRQRADYVIDTGAKLRETRAEAEAVYGALLERFAERLSGA